MAENKKSAGILIVVVLMALAGVAGAYMMFGKDAGDKLPIIQGDIAGKSENGPEVTAEEDHDDHQEHASDHHDHHGHDHHGHEHHNNQPQTTAEKPSLFDDLKEANPLAVNPVLGVRAAGNPDAPVKLTEVFSLTCSHCATFHNETYRHIKEEYIDTGKIYYVYQEFPLNAPALHASMVARCLPEERYAGYIDLLFRTQEKWIAAPDYKEALRQNAKLAGMSDEEFDTCLDNKPLQEALAGVIQEASKKWEIKSTPSLVFNDGEKVVVGAQKYTPMANAIEQFIARAQAPASE
ncbi:MAG: DsbA family protein [Alphaproteobacteria bacterium]|nr:DsbA family protein [Alphaproteobacteria bacterium]